MRSVITRIPDGTYEFEDCIDDDGLTDTPIRIHAKLIVAGGRNDGRSIRLRPSSDRTEQRNACFDVFRRVLRADGVSRCADSGERRVLSPGQDHRAPGIVHQCGVSRSRGASHRNCTPAGNRSLRRAASGDPGANAGGILRRVLCSHIPDGRSRNRPQDLGRDRNRRLWRSTLFRRRIRALVRHAQQLQHTDRNDRERDAVDVPRLRSADQLGWRRPTARRTRSVA